MKSKTRTFLTDPKLLNGSVRVQRKRERERGKKEPWGYVCVRPRGHSLMLITQTVERPDSRSP
jgi:hypothetical protein